MTLREKYKPVLLALEEFEDEIADEDIERSQIELNIALKELENCANCDSPFSCENGISLHRYSLDKDDTIKYGKIHFRIAACKYAKEVERAARIKALIESSGIKGSYRNKTFENFVVDEKNNKAYELCKSYAESFGPNSGNLFLFSGTPGTGKTHLACAITNYLLKQYVTCLFVVVPELLSEMSAKVGRNEDIFGVVQEIMDVPFLVLDDLGKEKISDWRKEQLYMIINDRVASNKPFVITSNCSLSELGKRLDKYIVSRIVENAQIIELEGTDRRYSGIDQRLY